jgi:hypothetical protein
MSRIFITRKTGVATAVTIVIFGGAVAFLKPITRHDLPSLTVDAVFTSNNAESVYAADPNDSWNRIFHLLFTRTVKADMSSDFPEAGPFTESEAMGVTGLRGSTRRFERVEIGDRAIEPLYPSFLSSVGALSILTEPRFSELKVGLTTAISDQNIRPPLARALMQCDAWAAYDIIFRSGNFRTGDDRQIGEHKEVLLSLLAQLIHKIALSSTEIRSLPANYSAAEKVKKLPALFSSKSGWLEIRLLPNREHDFNSAYRRAARVFVKPRQPPENKAKFVESLKDNQHIEELEAVALAIQNLLVDTSGRVVPSSIISDVQIRFFSNNNRRIPAVSEASEYELSRKLLLTHPVSGGLVEFDDDAPAYLAAAGNDYDFATPLFATHAPLVARLQTRCSQCHGTSLKHLMTLSIIPISPVPTVSILDAMNSDQAIYVASRKVQRDDYKSLLSHW